MTSAPGSPVITAAAAPRPSLRSLALRGSAWTLLGYTASQGLRLAGNVVLARLLFPEAFGLMLLVSLFMQGLQMFSDVGIAPSIVQSRRGEDRAFLNTAWTIQVIRGAVLFMIACALAWPFAHFMDAPQLLSIIPVSAVAAFIHGFQSTALASLNRSLRLRLITLWELCGQLVGILTMIAWAVVAPSVWALVAGGLAGALFRALTSHLLIRGYRNRFAWDAASARSLFRFGRWIFASTMLTFFAMQLDKIIMARILDVERLGIYGIAAGFAIFSTRLVKGVGGRVGFPALAEVARQRPHRLEPALWRMRLPLLGISSAVLLPMIVGGQALVDLLYDDRYRDAGWMLQILAAGAMAAAVSASAGHALLALGRSAHLALLQLVQLAFLVLATWVGHAVAGQMGIVAGIASAETLTYPLLACVLARCGLWQPRLDLPVLGAAAAALALGISLNHTFGSS